jgi:hypothetical protein
MTDANEGDRDDQGDKSEAVFVGSNRSPLDVELRRASHGWTSDGGPTDWCVCASLCDDPDT